MRQYHNPNKGSVKLAQNYTEYASNNSETTTNDETHFYNGMDGSAVQAFAPTGINYIYKKVQFNNPIRPDDTLILEFFNPSYGVWCDATQIGFGRFFNDDGTIAYGVDYVASGLKNINVEFRSAVSPIQTWSGFASDGWRWRIKKISGSNFAESVEVNKSVTVAGNYSIPQGISTVNVNASTATIDLSSVLLNSKVLIRKISAYDGNAITITPPSGATFEGKSSIKLYGKYSYVILERISATVFAIVDLKEPPVELFVYGEAGSTASADTPTVAKFATVSTDTHSAYSSTTGVFTVPIDGIYSIHAKLMIHNAGATEPYVQARIHTSASQLDCFYSSTNGEAYICANLDFVGRLTKGEKITVTFFYGTRSISLFPGSSASYHNMKICRVGN